MNCNYMFCFYPNNQLFIKNPNNQKIIKLSVFLLEKPKKIIGKLINIIVIQVNNINDIKVSWSVHEGAKRVKGEMTKEKRTNKMIMMIMMIRRGKKMRKH